MFIKTISEEFPNCKDEISTDRKADLKVLVLQQLPDVFELLRRNDNILLVLFAYINHFPIWYYMFFLTKQRFWFLDWGSSRHLRLANLLIQILKIQLSHNSTKFWHWPLKQYRICFHGFHWMVTWDKSIMALMEHLYRLQNILWKSYANMPILIPAQNL